MLTVPHLAIYLLHVVIAHQGFTFLSLKDPVLQERADFLENDTKNSYSPKQQ